MYILMCCCSFWSSLCFNWVVVVLFFTFCVISLKVLTISCLWSLLRLVRILTRVTASEPRAQDKWLKFSSKQQQQAMNGCGSRGTFPLQRRLDLHHIPVRVKIWEGSHRPESSPRHLLHGTTTLRENQSKPSNTNWNLALQTRPLLNRSFVLGP